MVMKKRTLRYIAAACCALVMQGMPVSAMTDAYPNGYVKIDTTHARDGLALNTAYILQDNTGKALAWGNGAFRAVEPVTDEDGTYYHSDPEVYFRWCIEYDAAETGFVLRLADKPVYLAYADGSFTVTEDQMQATVLTLQSDAMTSTQLYLYSKADDAYIKWFKGELSMEKEVTNLNFKPTAAENTIQFFYREGSNTTPTEYQSVTNWEGDKITLPELPVQKGAKAVCWQQLDPSDTTKVLGEYPAGETVSVDCGERHNAVFLAKYEWQEAKLIPVGTGSQQPAVIKAGQKITVQVGKNDASDYLLFENGKQTRLHAEESAAGVKELTLSLTEPVSYLCALETADDTECIRITSTYDFTNVRDMINTAAIGSGFDLLLKSDIDLSTVCGETSGSWTPIGKANEIGTPTAEYIFLHGNGMTIKNLYINADTDFLGLFGRVQELVVSDLTLTGTVKGRVDAGGLAGGCSVLRCSKTMLNMNVEGNMNIGGFAGRSPYLTLKNCGFAGSVTASENGGFFFGVSNTKTELSRCFAYGTVKGAAATGCPGKFSDIIYDTVYIPQEQAAGSPELNIKTASAAEFADGTVTAALNEKQEPALWAQGEQYPVIARGTYTLKVDYDKEGGVLAVPKMNYTAGETVAFTARANSGYEMTLTAETTGSKRALQILSGTDDHSWQFVMPAENVSLQIRFTKQPQPVYVPGDVDCSGTVDVADAVLLARLLTEDRDAVVTQTGRRNADVNNSGQPDAEDTVLILKCIAKLISFRVTEN